MNDSISNRRIDESLWLRRPSVRFAVILAALLIAYSPAIHAYYLHTDDYFYSGFAGFPHAAILTMMSVVGRPLAGVVYCAFATVKTMNGMNLLRALGIVNLAALGLWTYRSLRTQLPSAPVALAAAVAMLTTPPFVTSVGYLVMVPYAFAATVAAFAFVLVSEKVIGNRARAKWGFVALAWFLLLVSLSFYQPGALFYVSLAAVSTLLADPLRFYRDHVRKLAIHGAIMASACAVYYWVWRAGLQHARVPSIGKYDGRQFIVDFHGRAVWFLRTPLVEASNLWFVQPMAGVSILVACAVLVALCLEYSPARGAREIAAILGKAAVLGAMLPLTYAINLVSYMPSPEYRTYTALEGAIALLFLVSLARIFDRIAPSATAPAMAIVALGGICAAHVTIQRYYTVPDSKEFRFVKDRIDHYRHTVGSDFTMIDVIVRPRPVATVQRNEMGEPSLRHGPNLRPMVTAALRELGIARDVRVFQSLPDNPSQWIEWGTQLHWISLDYSPMQPPAGKAIVIDASQLESLR
jgi:hypothetical protein